MTNQTSSFSPDWSRNPRIRAIAAWLRAGAVAAYPTEAVWGLGCDPFNENAVARLLALKTRPLAKGLIIIGAEVAHLMPLIGSLSDEERNRLAAPSDKPLTWVVPAAGSAPHWITGGRATIAVRATRHPVAAGLCRAFGGALVSTSANPGGQPPARTAVMVRKYFGERVDAVAPGRVGSAAKPSEIRDLRSNEILRPGG